MRTVHVPLTTPVQRSFRAEQVAGMFDMPLAAPVTQLLESPVPETDERWTLGAIVGPSGSGKTTLARAAFGGAAFCEAAFSRAASGDANWPRDRAVIDLLDEAARRSGARTCSIKDLVRVLVGVGLGSVPTWLKPWGVLSTGERFRAALAVGLVSASDVLVCDEFTSALDRTFARTTAAAVGRLLRKSLGDFSRGAGPAAPRLVVVTCHDDVLAWLAPDWVVSLGRSGAGKLSWPRWSCPHLAMDVRRVPQAMWRQFAGQHYLSGGLAGSARCYGAWVDMGAAQARLPEEEPALLTARRTCVGFCAAVATLGWERTKHITRLVIRPEFQGLGLGGRLLEAVAKVEAAKGNRVTITATHPAIVGHCSKSPQWRLAAVKRTGSTRQRFEGREIRSSHGRAVASFEFLQTVWDSGPGRAPRLTS